MTARKFQETPVAIRPIKASIDVQPPYHSELSDEILAAVQSRVDSRKPSGFQLTPICAPGW